MKLTSLLALLILSCVGANSHANETKPNILLILTDDQGWPTLGCYGGEIVPTPHLDRLAAEGARFTDAYVTSQCTPTRATLLTGQYTARHGLWHVLPWYGYPWARMTEPAYAENYRRDQFTIAKGLRDAGYATGIMGKWHLTANEDGHYVGLFPHASHHYGFDFAPPILSKQEFAAGADRGVNTLTDQAIEFIASNRETPWFCFLSHHMIHGEVVAPEALTKKYSDLGYGDEGYNRAVYLAGLEHIDHSIGRLMAALEAMGEADETLIIFLSDNGGIDEKYDFKRLPEPVPREPKFDVELREYDNAPLRAGKGFCYEAGVRVPMIVRWPKGIPTQRTIHTPVHAIDILPTLFEVAGAEAPAETELDGRSLMTLLTMGADPELVDRPIYQYYPFYDLRWGNTPCASMRQGGWKLIEFFGDRVDAEGQYRLGHHLELYNLVEDIGEERNLADEQPARTERMRQQLHAWIKSLGREIPQKNAHYDPARAFTETRQKPDWLLSED